MIFCADLSSFWMILRFRELQSDISGPGQQHEMFYLNHDVLAHDSDVKALDCCQFGGNVLVASASRDGKVKVWTLNPDAQLGLSCEYKEHDGYVNAVALCPDLINPQELIIASAGVDAIINLYDFREQKLIGTLIGHANNICFLKYISPGKLLSCSWDGSVKFWHCLREHASLCHDGKAVWSACPVDNDLCLTAGADGIIRLWKNSTRLMEYSGHLDVVRSIQILDGEFCSIGDFLSVGNDGLLKLWRLSGKEIVSIEAHSSFIYSACSSKSFIFTAGEDQCIKVWAKKDHELECVQTIDIPATSIWNITISPLEQIICGTSDGRIYVFGSTCSKEPEILAEFEKRVVASKAEKLIEKVPCRDPSALDKKGKFTGENLIINRKGRGVVFQWDGSSWQEIGEVAGNISKSSKTVSDDSSDIVVDVQLEGGSKPLKLAFNITDNPLDVATKFIEEERLGIGYLSQIIEFIENTLRDRRGSSIPTQSKERNPDIPIFENVNTEGILRKLKEFGTEEGSEINKHDFKTLEKNIRGLLPVSSEIMDMLVCKLEGWSPEHFYPLFDCLRALELRKPGCSERLFERILTKATCCHSHSGSLATSIKLFCNLLGQENNASLNTDDFEKLELIIKNAFAHRDSLKDQRPTCYLVLRLLLHAGKSTKWQSSVGRLVATRLAVLTDPAEYSILAMAAAKIAKSTHCDRSIQSKVESELILAKIRIVGVKTSDETARRTLKQ